MRSHQGLLQCEKRAWCLGNVVNENQMIFKEGPQRRCLTCSAWVKNERINTKFLHSKQITSKSNSLLWGRFSFENYGRILLSRCGYLCISQQFLEGQLPRSEFHAFLIRNRPQICRLFPRAHWFPGLHMMQAENLRGKTRGVRMVGYAEPLFKWQLKEAWLSNQSLVRTC